ncbi:hypothetical protein AKJ16_DCAP18513 [Drosera capensis]
MDERLGDRSTKKLMSPCDVAALKKCLEENKGDYVKCQAQIEAFKTSCSLKKPNSSVKAPTRQETFRILDINLGESDMDTCCLCLFLVEYRFISKNAQGIIVHQDEQYYSLFYSLQ